MILEIFDEFGNLVGMLKPQHDSFAGKVLGFLLGVMLFAAIFGGGILVWPLLFFYPQALIVGIPCEITIYKYANDNSYEVLSGFGPFWLKIVLRGIIAGSIVGLVLGIITFNLLSGILTCALLGLWFSMLPAFILAHIMKKRY